MEAEYRDRATRPWLVALRERLAKSPLHWGTPVVCNYCKKGNLLAIGTLVGFKGGYRHWHCMPRGKR